MTEPGRLFANVIGASLIGGFLGALVTLFFVPIPEKNEQLITYMIGQLSGFAGGVIAYHYASKTGERDLDSKRADNTAKALDMAREAIAATPPGPIEAEITNDATNPVPVEEPKP